MNASISNDIQIINLQHNQKIPFTNPLSSSTPIKKSVIDEIQKIKQTKSIILNINGNCKINDEDLQILNDRYLILTDHSSTSANDQQQANCIDISTNERYICKIINEPYDKVVLAYFRLQNALKNRNYENHNDVDIVDDDEGHQFIRPAHEIIPQNSMTYLIIPQPFEICDNLNNDNLTGSENLHSYIRKHKKLQETEARSLFRQICKIVKFCHQNGVILRDLKLRKFFFIDSERTKLQYESLEGAVLLDDDSLDDTLTEKIGCPLYVSPELIISNSSYGGQAADMWALGVILYTILVGKYPFNDGQGQTIFAKISNCNFYIPNGLSIKAKCLIQSLLRKNPDERLNCDDVLYHSWFNETLATSSSSNDPEDLIQYFNSKTDQCVPEGDSFYLT